MNNDVLQMISTCFTEFLLFPILHIRKLNDELHLINFYERKIIEVKEQFNIFHIAALNHHVHSQTAFEYIYPKG